MNNAENNNTQRVQIELLQGENAPIVVNTELTRGCNLTEVSGTLAYRLIKLRLKAQKYKMNLGGFSFARKFDVKVTINGTSSDGTNSIGMGCVKFGITLQNNEKSFNNFHGFITELVNDILCGDSELEGTFEELKDELTLKVA